MPRKKRYYSRKTYRNPFFSRKKPVFSWRVYTLGILVLLISLAVCYVLFYSQLFVIKDVVVTGAEKVNVEDIQQLAYEQMNTQRYLIFPQKNLLVFDDDRYFTTLNENYFLEKLEIKKRPFHGLKIDINEKNPVVTWVNQNHFYHLDLRGQVIEEIPQFIQISNEVESEEDEIVADDKKPSNEVDTLTKSSPESSGEILGEVVNVDKITIYALNSQEINLGQQVTSEDIITLAREISEKLPREIGLEIKQFEITEPWGREVVVILNSGSKIYFSLDISLTDQLRNLKLLYTEKIQKENISFKYIDLRWGEKVYYK